MTQPPLPPTDRPDEPDADRRADAPASPDQPGYMPPGYQPPGSQSGFQPGSQSGSQSGFPQPYGQAGWGAPPAPARPGTVTAAAIVLIVLGVLAAILGLFFLLGASLIGSGTQLPGLDIAGATRGALAGVLVVFGGVMIAFGILEVLSGINIFSAKGWARILAIVLSVIGGLIGVLALIPSRDPDMASGPIFGIIVLVAYAFVIWALATTGRYFTR